MTDYLERVNEIEKHFCSVGEECVFLAKNPQALKAMLIASVWGAEEYKNLPKKSQTYVAGYIQGVARAAAKARRTTTATVPTSGRRSADETRALYQQLTVDHPGQTQEWYAKQIDITARRLRDVLKP